MTTGVKEFKERLGIYLTNTLDEGSKIQQDLFSSIGLAEAISHEAVVASKIKTERPIMVIVGNPPYSGESSNKTEYALSLVAKYKYEPGGVIKLQERNPKWINDDYVKFIAFAEDMIDKNGEGIMAIITNHSYLDNPTFRGMRWHLAKTFDEIYVLDLHGNAKKKETAKDGSKDENVFAIQQGVAIIIAIKTGKKRKSELANVFHAEIYSTRRHKFDQLDNIKPSWQKLKLDPRMLYFSNNSTEGKDEYDEGTAINELFITGSVGIVTARDQMSIQLSQETIESVVEEFKDLEVESLRDKYRLGKDVRDWSVEGAKQDVTQNAGKIEKVAYRPFDTRYTYFTVNSRGFHCYPRENVMRNFLLGDNVGLMVCRQQKTDGFYHAFIHENIVESSYISNKTSEIGSTFPLYLYHMDGTKTPNFNQRILKEFTKNLTKDYNPEDILDYIYGVLHSPQYREKYKGFLKSDFPRVPAPKEDNQFNELLELGNKLRNLHLMKDPEIDNYTATFPITGNNDITKVSYMDDRVYINEHQYFGDIPNIAWNFYIGGYQPAQKWLKDRKNKILSSQDIMHYQQIIKVLVETDEIMRKIDKVKLI